MIIDGKDMILGRLCTFVAKQALQGNQIDIINAEQVIITGSKANIYEKYRHRMVYRGQPRWGPFFYKKEDMFLKRAIRGMIPYDTPRGRKAVKLIKCHIGVPQEFEGKKFETLKNGNIADSSAAKYITIKHLCRLLGRAQ